MRNDSQKFAFFLLHFLEYDDSFLEYLGIERSESFVKEHGINANVAARKRRDAKSKREAYHKPFAAGDVVNRTHGTCQD